MKIVLLFSVFLLLAVPSLRAQQVYTYDNPEKVLYLLTSKGKVHFLVQAQYKSGTELLYIVNRLKKCNKGVWQVQNDREGLTEVVTHASAALSKAFFITQMQAIYKDIANIRATTSSEVEANEYFKRAVLGL